MLHNIFKKLKFSRSSDSEVGKAVANNPEQEIVTVNSMNFTVASHWFWKEFRQQMWEPYTYELMRKSLHAGSVYVDVGTWVGPTILYAAEIGVKNIYGIEANPLTFKLLTDTISFNPGLAGVHLTNACVTDRDNTMVSFGGKSGEDTSSASSIRGDCWTVKSTTLLGYLASCTISKIDLLKIDIEGAETFIVNDLMALSTQPHLTVSLSLHPPMWDDRQRNAETMVRTLDHFSVFQADDTPIDSDEIYRRLMTDETHPAWGTSFGNFFEVILRTGKRL